MVMAGSWVSCKRAAKLLDSVVESIAVARVVGLTVVREDEFIAAVAAYCELWPEAVAAHERMHVVGDEILHIATDEVVLGDKLKSLLFKVDLLSTPCMYCDLAHAGAFGLPLQEVCNPDNSFTSVASWVRDAEQFIRLCTYMHQELLAEKADLLVRVEHKKGA